MQYWILQGGCDPQHSQPNVCTRENPEVSSEQVTNTTAATSSLLKEPQKVFTSTVRCSLLAQLPCLEIFCPF